MSLGGAIPIGYETTAAAVSAFEEYDERKSQAVVWIGLSRLVRLRPARCRENGQPFAHVGPCRDRDAESNKTPTNEKRPNVGPQGRPGCQTGCLPYAKVNLPRSAFLNREFFPLALISRASAEYKVARGVLPAGDFQ